MVSINASCDDIDPWAAIVIGIIGSLCCSLFSKLLEKLKIDDPVQSSCVHFAGGAWGLIACGFFKINNGLFYDNPDKGKFFGVQILGVVMIILWSGGLSFIYFVITKKLGWLKEPWEVQVVGIDIAEMS